ncbi:unnamed protein product [Porites evermanni]|uniref:Uncharacterized protein n=1 Tax=Porites evermanni TaxID=104178 RepID=A0ABN8Q8J5_9CNID|nr:unnamed protein product [Porites evermanni]
MARLLLLFIAGMIFAAHASVIPGDSLSENEIPAEELGEEDFDEREDSDEMPEEGEEVDEGQPQEDTSDAAMTPEDAKWGKSYKPYKRYCYYRFQCRYCVYRWIKCKGYGYRRCRYHVCYGCKRSCVYRYYRGSKKGY